MLLGRHVLSLSVLMVGLMVHFPRMCETSWREEEYHIVLEIVR